MNIDSDKIKNKYLNTVTLKEWKLIETNLRKIEFV